MPLPSADTSVRLAWADDAPAIATVQVEVWRTTLAGVVPEDRLPRDPGAVEPAWRALLTRPGDARRRVLVALERDRLVGFVLTGPTTDPDRDPVVTGEVAELTVAPGLRGQGHGSRLLQAAADTLRADRFTTAVAWVRSDDDALRTFLTEAGWATDGAHRELAVEDEASGGLREVRLHTALV